MRKKVLGLIPARGGSKGVPRKNIKILGGRPLLYYTAKPALESKLLNKVIISTEDQEIADIARTLGIEVPFLRPQELALDTTPTLPALIHALEFMKNELNEEYDYLCLLQPTNPLRDVETIDACIAKIIEEDLDSVFTTLEVPTEVNPHWVYFEKENQTLELSTGGYEPIPRRQSLPRAYYREGSVYVTKTSVILEQNSLYGNKVGGYLLNQPCPINIDTMEDWEKAESYFKLNNLCAE